MTFVLQYNKMKAANVSITAIIKGIFLPMNFVVIERMMTKGNPLKPNAAAGKKQFQLKMFLIK